MLLRKTQTVPSAWTRRRCPARLIAFLSLGVMSAPAPAQSPASRPAFTFDHGGIVRGDTSRKAVALIFTGGDYGEGTPHILDVLKRQRVKASFFFTGAFLRKPQHAAALKRIVPEGHYLGPHSDGHPLYCAWENREKTLVTKEFFKQDLEKNLSDLRALGATFNEAHKAAPATAGANPDPASSQKPVYFIPPYEWFNREQVAWAREMGLCLFNFTPGIGSQRDYVPEGQPRFASSREIYDGILAYERNNTHGLRGALLLMHVGAKRKDKMFLLLEPLIVELKGRGYSFVRVNEMLRGACRAPIP